MLTRKTQYAWMAMGGLICLFGLILACKLRDGNKAIAQSDKPPDGTYFIPAESKPSSPSPANKESKETKPATRRLHAVHIVEAAAREDHR